MGFLSFLLGRANPSPNKLIPIPPKLSGKRRYPCEVVGESNYDAGIAKAVGGKREDGFDNVGCQVILVLDDENKYDENAVAVFIHGHQAGHLSRTAAKNFRAAVAGFGAQSFTCDAVIRGGWDRGNGDTGNFGIWLDLEL